MILVIHDACVLIDLQGAGLLDVFFQLHLESHTTDMVIREIRQSLRPYISNHALRVKSHSGEEVIEVARFMAAQPRKISPEDASVLLLSLSLHGVLLTGDGNLRYCGERLGIEVRGTLWVLDRLVEANLLAEFDAARILKRLMSTGSRLPTEACKQRLQKWDPE